MYQSPHHAAFRKLHHVPYPGCRGGRWKWQPVVSPSLEAQFFGSKQWLVFIASHLLPPNNGTAAILPGEHGKWPEGHFKINFSYVVYSKPAPCGAEELESKAQI